MLNYIYNGQCVIQDLSWGRGILQGSGGCASQVLNGIFIIRQLSVSFFDDSKHTKPCVNVCTSSVEFVCCTCIIKVKLGFDSEGEGGLNLGVGGWEAPLYDTQRVFVCVCVCTHTCKITLSSHFLTFTSITSHTCRSCTVVETTQ